MSERIEHAGVEGLRVGRFPSRLASSCILYRMGRTVIDTGPPNQWRRVLRFLDERAVERVIVTHHHEDHSGNLARLDGRSAALLSPPGSVERISEGFALKPYQRFFWGTPRRARPQAVPEEIEVDGGRTLRAVATPGHSDDMTCYLDVEHGHLFTGDLYIASRTRYLRADEDLGAQIASLGKVLELDFETVFCAHRGVVRDGKAALARKLDFLQSLVERVAHLRAEGHDVGEVTRRLLGREDLTSLMTGFHFSKRNLVAGCWAITDG